MGFKDFLRFLFDELVSSGLEYQAKKDALADEIISKEKKYGPIRSKEDAERLERQRQAVAKAKAYKEKREREEAEKYNTSEDDEKEDIYEEYEEYNPDQYSQQASTTYASSYVDSSRYKLQKEKYSELLKEFDINPLKSEIVLKSVHGAATDIIMYLNRSFNNASEYFFDVCVTMRLENKSLFYATRNDFRVPNEYIIFGFAEKGVHHFDNGFAFTDNYFIYRANDNKTLNIPIREIQTVAPYGKSVLVNNVVVANSSYSPFSAKLLADIINIYIVRSLKSKLLI